MDSLTNFVTLVWVSWLFLNIPVCTSLATLAQNQSIRDGDVLISNGRNFAFGFFNLGHSSFRYVGIWYNKVSEKTVVWVANRDNPITTTSGLLSFNDQGNLALYNHRNVPVWSTNASVASPSNSIVQLLDSGNLVILDRRSQRIIWQSFDHPSDTMLPYLKIGVDKRTGLSWFLKSWKSQDDPGTGNISYRIDPRGSPQLFLYKGQVPLWRVGSWTGQRWSGVPEMTSNFIFNVSFVNNDEEVSVMWGIKDPTVITRMVVDETGEVKRSTWNQKDHRWVDFWSAPKEKCDTYGLCGSNGNCDPYINPDQFECTCLPSFQPKSPRDWYLRDGSSGCVRRQGSSTCLKGEGFVKVENVKAPDTSYVRVDMSLDLRACEEQCLRNCSCVAYTSADEVRKTGCITWHGDLVDTRTFSNSGQDLYVRVDAIELDRYKGQKGHLGKKTMLSIVLPAAVAILILVFSLVSLIRKRRGRRDQDQISLRFLGGSTSFGGSPSAADFDDNRKDSELPFFDLRTVAALTNNFSAANKLGEGGFGSVYKGMLRNRKEVAVKRLSKYSGQGIEEFKNEVSLIAKLQHINLVKILGCCIEGEEKMLIYEYLPNKSLDHILFDETKKSLLDWGKRFEIICGVARGILYLHQDSRLRIIHRDLKASNVLLDSSMMPKISDFGMARIFGRNQVEANTNRVVGTYGYMSPEYAMEGLYSTKSDVYSFGVLVLEIVTGQKNNNFHESSSSSLVGHVWDSWKEGKVIDTIDSSILRLEESFPFPELDQVIRYIQIGLLCVQEHAVDRPTMSTVVSTLVSDSPLPAPKQPAFIFKRTCNEAETSTTSEGAYSVNEMSVTVLVAR